MKRLLTWLSKQKAVTPVPAKQVRELPTLLAPEPDPHIRIGREMAALKRRLLREIALQEARDGRD